MSINQFVLTGLTVLGLASAAMADGRNPGSLLLYPEFDNRTMQPHPAHGHEHEHATSRRPDGSRSPARSSVEFVYIGRYGTTASRSTASSSTDEHLLTPNDTLTLLTSVHNPQQEQGYVYVFAKDRADRPGDRVQPPDRQPGDARRASSRSTTR